MQVSRLWQAYLFAAYAFMMTGCATDMAPQPQQPPDDEYPYSSHYDESKYEARLPQKISMGHEKVIVVDPKLFAWGAYDEEGNLVKGGIATAGAEFCEDEGAPCKTTPGTFHIFAMKGEECASKQYPVGKGGALMPYCSFFHNGESLHGSPDRILVEQNISHGCVHIRIPDAEWIQHNFASIGTKVVIESY